MDCSPLRTGECKSNVAPAGWASPAPAPGEGEALTSTEPALTSPAGAACPRPAPLLTPLLLSELAANQTPQPTQDGLWTPHQQLPAVFRVHSAMQYVCQLCGTKEQPFCDWTGPAPKCHQFCVSVALSQRISGHFHVTEVISYYVAFAVLSIRDSFRFNPLLKMPGSKKQEHKMAATNCMFGSTICCIMQLLTTTSPLPLRVTGGWELLHGVGTELGNASILEGNRLQQTSQTVI